MPDPLVSAPPDRFDCVECGGTAHLISYLPDDEPVEPGTPLAYRCAECADRFDVVWSEESDDPEGF